MATVMATAMAMAVAMAMVMEMAMAMQTRTCRNNGCICSKWQSVVAAVSSSGGGADGTGRAARENE